MISYDTIENAEETLSESIFEFIGIFNIVAAEPMFDMEKSFYLSFI